MSPMRPHNPFSQNARVMVCSAAARISADAIGSVHAEALSRQSAAMASSSEAGPATAVEAEGVVAFKLLRLLAEECRHRSAPDAARAAVAALAPQTLGCVGAAMVHFNGSKVGGQGGGAVAVAPARAAASLTVAALRCLQQWTIAARVTLEDAVSPQRRCGGHMPRPFGCARGR